MPLAARGAFCEDCEGGSTFLNILAFLLGPVIAYVLYRLTTTRATVRTGIPALAAGTAACRACARLHAGGIASARACAFARLPRRRLCAAMRGHAATAQCPALDGVGAARAGNSPGLCSPCLAGSARRTDAGLLGALAAMQEQVCLAAARSCGHR